ncbi:hypothetical protein E4U42_004794 [Claviceps africana]|uniref:GH16 domain-containing protein n=1 Tax=Claviceps africana TaxID=83212 RepID=A0A8K0J4Q0_9HYPO|nr:hypothetical protein E4U42_004794 [Claviceps africana]
MKPPVDTTCRHAKYSTSWSYAEAFLFTIAICFLALLPASLSFFVLASSSPLFEEQEAATSSTERSGQEIFRYNTSRHQAVDTRPRSLRVLINFPDTVPVPVPDSLIAFKDKRRAPYTSDLGSRMHRLIPFLTWLSCVSASLKDLASCDPLRKDMHCPPDPAFAGETFFDFNSSSWDDPHFADFWSVDNGTAQDRKRLEFGADGKGLAMGMFKTGDAPTLVSNKYLLFGKVSVTMQAARGRGLITAMVLKSDSGDEIDWELLGAYDHQAQTNYFYDGQALFNTYNDTYDLATSSFDAPQTYAVEWTDQFLRFSINDTVRKVWYPGEIPAAKWPQTPMQVKLGVWSVGNDSDHGTVAWAGGVPDWEAGPYRALFTGVRIQDYAGFCNETDGSGRVEYQYDERTVGWQEIRIAGCKARPGPELQTPSQVESSVGAGPSETAAPGGGGEENGAATARLSGVIVAVVALSWLVAV